MENSTAIVKHNFEAAKGEIRRFSNNLPSNQPFEKVETDAGLFGWSDHKVTGEELNNLTDKIQGRFIALNSSLRDVVKEFNEVFNALDALDKDYIQAILFAVNEAKESSKKALDAQKNIGKTIEALKLTVEKLKGLDAQVSAIDAKFKELDSTNSRAEELYHSFEEQYNPQEIQQIHDELLNLHNNVESLQLFATSVESIKHLYQIDESWDKLNNTETLLTKTVGDLSILTNRVSLFSSATETKFNEFSALMSTCSADCKKLFESIESHTSLLSGLRSDMNKYYGEFNDNIKNLEDRFLDLDVFRKDIDAIPHLHDLNLIWEDIQFVKTEILSVQGILSGLSAHVDSEVLEIKKAIENMKVQMSLENKLLNRKVIIAYIIGGVGCAASIVLFILNILNII